MVIEMARSLAFCVVRCMLMAGVLACEPEPPAKSAPPMRAIAGLEVYMPLYDGFVYQYDVETDTGETGRMMVQVSRPRPGLAELNVAGKIQRLEVSPAAVVHATGGFLLRAPVQEGAKYKGQFGQVRVVSVSRAIQTPAGDFTGCIETVEEATLPTPKRATSIFCPKVGLVALDIEGALEGEAASVATRLRSFGPMATGDE